MIEPQYGAAIDALLADMQKMKEQKELNASAVGLNSDISDDGFYDAVGGPCASISYKFSWRELAEFEKYKCSVFFPRMKSTKFICNDEVESVIKFGWVIWPGSDLPTGHNFSNYADSGRFNFLDFFDYHKVQFTYL